MLIDAQRRRWLKLKHWRYELCTSEVSWDFGGTCCRCSEEFPFLCRRCHCHFFPSRVPDDLSFEGGVGLCARRARVSQMHGAHAWNSSRQRRTSLSGPSQRPITLENRRTMRISGRERVGRCAPGAWKLIDGGTEGGLVHGVWSARPANTRLNTTAVHMNTAHPGGHHHHRPVYTLVCLCVCSRSSVYVFMLYIHGWKGFFLRTYFSNFSWS